MANRSALILQLARQVGIRDPRAVLAVAAQEGLGGGIGDAGTSFGPFQLHVGGAFPGHIKGNRQKWAWSRPGLLYALNQIKGVAGNLQGPAAINAIVSRFERPADPGAEIAKALAYYRRGRSGVPADPARLGAGATQTGAPQAGQGSSILAALLANPWKAGEKPEPIDLAAFKPPVPAAPRMGAPMPLGGAVSGSNAIGAAAGFGTPVELFYRQLALKHGQRIGAIPHHNDHLHYAAGNYRQMLRAIALAKKLGLRVGENPAAGDHVDPVHVKGSYHYQRYPGNRRVGEAIDVSGNPQLLMKLYRRLAGGR